jgi:hypothetical protein
MPFASTVVPRAAVAPTAGRRAGAKPPASARAVSLRGRESRGASLATRAFGFGKKAAPEPEEEAEEDEPMDISEGNPFASMGAKLEESAGAKLKLPSLGGFNFSRDPDDEVLEEEEEEEETESAPKGGNPFASFGGFGTVGRTIDQTVDLDYDDDDEEEEAAGPGNPFGGFALPSFGGAKDAPAAASAPAAPEKKEKKERKMGNWERTLKEGVRDDETPTWTIDPEPIRGASLRPFKLFEGDVKVLGRDKGPGIDVVAKVGCVSGVHCQLEMENNKLYVTDLGSTNGTYVDGQEMRKNNRYRVFNGSTLRLGAENVNGEPYVSYEVDLSGAKEMDRNSEYGQVQAIVEALGGPKVVVNFLFINVAFQLGFYLLLQLQTD